MAALCVFYIFDKHANCLANFGLVFFVFPLISSDRSFTLVADIDKDELLVHTNDFAFDYLVDIDVLAFKPASIAIGQFADRIDPILF